MYVFVHACVCACVCLCMHMRVQVHVYDCSMYTSYAHFFLSLYALPLGSKEGYCEGHRVGAA